MSVMLDHILRALIVHMVDSGQLLLAPHTDVDALVSDIRAQLAEAPPFAQAGPFLANALMASEHVDELFASDVEIIEALSAIRA